MALAAQRILIIGGGFSGMSAAIALRRLGADVDLVEIDSGWRSYGAGISLGGATLRVFRQLGILEEYLKVGAVGDGVVIRTPHGQVLATLPTPRLAGDGIPGGGAVMRPALAHVLAEATRASGTQVRLGCTFTTLEPDEDGVTVGFTDGQRQRYDLVIGADGLYSKTRPLVLPQAPSPQYFGQAVWRAVLPRPAEVQTVNLWVGGDVKPGINPVNAEAMYLFVTETRPVNEYVAPETFLPSLRALLEPFSDPLLQHVRDLLTAESQIVYRPLEGLLVRGPWYQGRIVLIGDTVHATTPHLASGACIGMEDAVVLAEELAQRGSVGDALAAFQARRWERCRLVVENSGRLGEIEKTHGDMNEHARITRDSLAALAQPI
jgi:2-polyprenyl-6-methoxyphenol hydroxylase-like FAD-dependent oxidoreductase